MRIVAAVLLLSCTPALAQSRGRPANFKVPAEQRKELLGGIEQQLRDHYIFPERLEAAVPQLRARWATLEKDDAHALTDQINADLRDVFHDGHLFLRLAAALPPGFDDADDKPDLVLDAFHRRMNQGVVKAEVLPGNIGVLEIIAFPLGGPRAYAAALAFLKDTDALIIDLRQNGGGDGEAVADL